MSTEELIYTKDRETARFNYEGKVRITNSYNFSGKINLETSEIDLEYPSHFETEKLEQLVEKPFRSAVTSLLRHELNHKGGGDFKGCPRNLDLHIKNVYTPVAQTLLNLGFRNRPVTTEYDLFDCFTNLIEDIINNAEISYKTDHTSMFLVYKTKAERMDNQKFTNLYDAFVSLQEKIYGNKNSTKLLSDHHSSYQRVQEVVKNVMNKLGLNKYSKKQQTDCERENVARIFCDEDNWKNISTAVTEEFSKLLNKDKIHQPGYLKKQFGM